MALRHCTFGLSNREADARNPALVIELTQEGRWKIVDGCDDNVIALFGTEEEAVAYARRRPRRRICIVDR